MHTYQVHLVTLLNRTFENAMQTFKAARGEIAHLHQTQWDAQTQNKPLSHDAESYFQYLMDYIAG